MDSGRKQQQPTSAPTVVVDEQDDGRLVGNFVTFLNRTFNPLKPNFSNYYTLPRRPHLPFLISDIRALKKRAS